MTVSSDRGVNKDNDKPRKKYSKEIILAKWEDRFVAWLIDFVIISIIVNIFFLIFSIQYSFPFWGVYLDDQQGFGIKQPYEYFIASFIFFIYWLVLEFTTGQTIGKRVVHIKTTNLYGDKANIVKIAIESFGKSFLLPVDIVLGLIFSNKRRQRIFNKVSGTIIIKLKKIDEDEDNDIAYIKDH